MTLDDLLETLKRDMLHDRSDLVAGDSDQLWSDTSLIRYIDQAQRRFARRSLCIRDSTSDITRFTTVVGQQSYILDPSVISVYSIRSLGNGIYIGDTFTVGAYNTANPPVFVPVTGVNPIYPGAHDLPRVAHRTLNARYYSDEFTGWEPPSNISGGLPLFFETDETVAESGGSSGVVTVTLAPAPRADLAGCVMQMRVARLPLVRLTPQNLEAVPEIPEDYHLDMLDYAAYLALRIVDHELGDPTRAAEFQASFDRHVEEARLELMRKTFAPQLWGFGGNGFSYTGN